MIYRVLFSEIQFYFWKAKLFYFDCFKELFLVMTFLAPSRTVTKLASISTKQIVNEETSESQTSQSKVITFLNTVVFLMLSLFALR